MERPSIGCRSPLRAAVSSAGRESAMRSGKADGAAILVTDSELIRLDSPSSALIRTSNSRPGCFASKSFSLCLRIFDGVVPEVGSNSAGSQIRKTRASLEGDPVGVTFDGGFI